MVNSSYRRGLHKNKRTREKQRQFFLSAQTNGKKISSKQSSTKGVITFYGSNSSLSDFSLLSSDQSDSDNGIVYAGNRPKSPQTTKKSTDYRQMTNSVKLPILDLNKTKGKQSGNQTYSESDHEDDTPARSRANFSRPTVDSDRHDIPTTSSAGGMNKKKKLIGASSGSHDNDLSTKKSNDSQPKSFRSSYEPFPEESPWSASGKKVGKPDDLSARSFGKPSTSSDFNKRTTSPLVHDTKPYGSSALSKRDKDSGDEDDEFNGKGKLKVKSVKINSIAMFSFLDHTSLYQ